jgi:putative DNA primase/helicase
VKLRPVILKVRVKNVPKAMRAERRWVMWRLEWDGKRWTKRPYQVSGSLARTDDPSTWTTFAHACIALQTGRFDGIGFVLGDGWAGIDLDDCVKGYDPDTGGLLATTDDVGPFVMALDRSSAYWEISPSGTGYKAIGRSSRIGGEVRFSTSPPTRTTWTGARFFTITGHYQSMSDDATVDISGLIEQWFPAAVTQPAPSASTGFAQAAEMSDRDLVIHIAGHDEHGEKFAALFAHGDTSAYGGDHSRADQALVTMLAWWTNYDMARVDRLFRESKLYRSKWDTASYRRATLAKAAR